MPRTNSQRFFAFNFQFTNSTNAEKEGIRRGRHSRQTNFSGPITSACCAADDVAAIAASITRHPSGPGVAATGCGHYTRGRFEAVHQRIDWNKTRRTERSQHAEWAVGRNDTESLECTRKWDRHRHTGIVGCEIGIRYGRRGRMKSVGRLFFSIRRHQSTTISRILNKTKSIKLKKKKI